MVQRSKKRLEVSGVLAGGIIPQVDVSFRVTQVQLLELRLKLLVTAAGFYNGQWFGSGLFVFAEKRHVMPEPRGIDSHAEMLANNGR